MMTFLNADDPVFLWEDDFSYADFDALIDAYDEVTTDEELTTLSSEEYMSADQSLFIEADEAGHIFLELDSAVNTDEESLVVSFWMYDPVGLEGGDWDCGRLGVTLSAWADGAWGEGDLQNLVFLGSHHNPLGGGATYYSMRITDGFETEDDQGWDLTNIERSEGWHEFTMVLHEGIATFYIDGTHALEGEFDEPEAGWHSVRIGSPARAVHRGDWYFDDLVIYLGEMIVPTSASHWHLFD